MGASESRTAGRPAAQRGARPQDRFYSPDQSPSRATRPVQLSPSFPPQPSTLHPAHAYPSAYGESVVHDVPGTTTEDATTATPTVSTPRRPRPARRRVRTRADKLVLCVKPTQSGKTFEMVESVGDGGSGTGWIMDHSAEEQTTLRVEQRIRTGWHMGIFVVLPESGEQ